MVGEWGTLNISYVTKSSCSSGSYSAFHSCSCKFPRESNHQNPGGVIPGRTSLAYEASRSELGTVGPAMVAMVHYPDPAFGTKKLIPLLPEVLAHGG